FDKDKVIAIEKGNTTDNIYGLAIDIGTTTVAADLVDMKSGKAILSSSDINPQKKFGLDVLTRITYALENEEQAVKNLQHEIVNLINKMTFEMCMSANISKEHIYEVSVAANTTMLHFLLGIKSNSIGKSPYAPVFVKSKYIKASRIGININSNGKLYCLPGVSSYIGSDIVAGAFVAKLHDSKDNILFIDIGTNGEIVLASKGKLLSCSCAAGPALEGMNISCGMRGEAGAIEDMVIDKEQVRLSVIGGEQQPIGICGSGILAALRELLKTGIVKKDGSFIKKEKLAEDDYRQKYIRLNGKKREFMIEDKAKTLYITQSDIRQIQLAKGAILSGFYALLNKSGISINELDKVVIAGQFGSHLSVDSLTGTGILPKEVESKITYVGNSSKTGAYMALMSDDIKKDLEQIAKTIDYMELGASDGYERLFADCLLF
ncbi:ASKHA domain-containing protein, partial [Acetoanaerobium noterae]|uniref:ASKHA domain-containing protein n=1 Tax=Acetoanaerobium noterae TaxID=745369 RepID=UPI003222220E